MQSQRLIEISNEIERLNRLHTEAKQKGRADMAIEFKTQGEQYAEKLKVLSALPTVRKFLLSLLINRCQWEK